MADTAVFEQLPADLSLGDNVLDGMCDVFGHGLLSPSSSAPTSPMPQGHLDLITNDTMTLDPAAFAQPQTISAPPPPPAVYPRPGETTLRSPSSWLTPSGNALPLAAAVSAARASDPAANATLLEANTKLSISKQQGSNLDRRYQIALVEQEMARIQYGDNEQKIGFYRDMLPQIGTPITAELFTAIAHSLCPRAQPADDNKENREVQTSRVARAPAKAKALLPYRAPPSPPTDTESSDADDFKPREHKIARRAGPAPLALPPPRVNEVIRVSPPSSPDVGIDRLSVGTPNGKRKATQPPDVNKMYNSLVNKYTQTTNTIIEECRREIRKTKDDLCFTMDTKIGVMHKKYEKLKPLETVILYVFALQNYCTHPPLDAVTKTIVTRSGNGMPGFPVAVKEGIGGKAIHAFDLLAIIRLALNAELRMGEHTINSTRLSVDVIKKDLIERFKADTIRTRNSRLEPTASIFMRNGPARRGRNADPFEAKVMRQLAPKDSQRAALFDHFPDARINKDGEPDLMLLIYPGVSLSHGWNTLSKLQHQFPGVNLHFLSVVTDSFPPTINKKDTPMFGFDE